MNAYRRILPILTAISILLIATSGDVAIAENPNIDAMTETIKSGTSAERIQLATSLDYSGITDKELFDAINKAILDEYPTVGANSQKIDEVSWLCKGLATSGRLEYKPTFEQILATNAPSKLKRHTRNSLAYIDDFAAWNPYINSKDYAQDGRSASDAKNISMLKSGIPVLQKKAAGRVINSPTSDEAVYEVIAEELIKGYSKSPKDGAHFDAMGWLCKALGVSGRTKYRSVLEEVKASSPSRKIKRHAKKALASLS